MPGACSEAVDPADLGCRHPSPSRRRCYTQVAADLKSGHVAPVNWAGGEGIPWRQARRLDRDRLILVSVLVSRPPGSRPPHRPSAAPCGNSTSCEDLWRPAGDETGGVLGQFFEARRRCAPSSSRAEKPDRQTHHSVVPGRPAPRAVVEGAGTPRCDHRFPRRGDRSGSYPSNTRREEFYLATRATRVPDATASLDLTGMASSVVPPRQPGQYRLISRRAAHRRLQTGPHTLTERTTRPPIVRWGVAQHDRSTSI